MGLRNEKGEKEKSILMELKSLVLGLFFSIGIFALKSGVGLHYFFYQQNNIKTKLFSFSLLSATYFGIFVFCAHILQKIDIIHYFEIIQTFLKSGMFIHILMAGGLIIWGIILLKGKNRKTLGWLALIIPCPVCVTVIFFSTAFLLSCFPDSGLLSVIWAYLGFMTVVIITVISMSLWRARSGSTPESTLGAAMLIIAVYFFLSVIIMPQFGDMDKIYRLAAYQGEEQTVSIRDILLLYGAMITLFAAGFGAMRRRIRRKKNWT